MDGTCRVEACGRPIVVMGERLCQSHYGQWRRGEPFREVTARGKRLAVEAAEMCAFGPCERVARAKGYCNTHYLQSYHGRPLRMCKAPVPTTKRDDQGRKWCSTCEQWRPEADFASSKGAKDGLQTRCRPCNAAIYRSRADVVRDKMREQRFGLSREQFDALFASQGNACGICGTTEPGSIFWAVDHDHACCPSSDKTCGQCVRGILCARCNHGLGNFKDRVDLLLNAIQYLSAATREAAA